MTAMDTNIFCICRFQPLISDICGSNCFWIWLLGML